MGRGHIPLGLTGVNDLNQIVVLVVPIDFKRRDRRAGCWGGGGLRAGRLRGECRVLQRPRCRHGGIWSAQMALQRLQGRPPGQLRLLLRMVWLRPRLRLTRCRTGSSWRRCGGPARVGALPAGCGGGALGGCGPSSGLCPRRRARLPVDVPRPRLRGAPLPPPG